MQNPPRPFGRGGKRYSHFDQHSLPKLVQLSEVLDGGDHLREFIREKHLRLMIVGSITIDYQNRELDCMSAAFRQMAGVFSELELLIIRARVKSGMANAKASGKKVGRPQLTKRLYQRCSTSPIRRMQQGR